jgi:hypothetical protein
VASDQASKAIADTRRPTLGRPSVRVALGGMSGLTGCSLDGGRRCTRAHGSRPGRLLCARKPVVRGGRPKPPRPYQDLPHGQPGRCRPAGSHQVLREAPDPAWASLGLKEPVTYQSLAQLDERLGGWRTARCQPQRVNSTMATIARLGRRHTMTRPSIRRCPNSARRVVGRAAGSLIAIGRAQPYDLPNSSDTPHTGGMRGSATPGYRPEPEGRHPCRC